jgi:P63C domain
MEPEQSHEQKKILDEIQKQIEFQKQADKQRQEDEEKLKEQIEKEKTSLLNFFVEQADALTPQKKKKKNAQDEQLKKYLTGVGVTSIDEQNKIIAQFKQPYIPHFTYDKDYYKEIFRLNLWSEDAYKNYYKPREVAVWTVRLIYGLFMKELPTIMEELRAKNKYVGFCIRRYKFFQFLTPEAQVKLDGFIEDCIKMMKQYNDWGSFEKDYCEKHGLPYQKRLF